MAEQLDDTRRRRRRFRVPILIIVVMVVFVSLFLVPLRPHRASELAARTRCVANLRAIGNAIRIYSQQHGEYPGADPLAVLVASGLLDRAETQCPNGGVYIMLPPAASDRANSDPRRLVGYEATSNHGEVINAVFADGHAESIKTEAFVPPK